MKVWMIVLPVLGVLVIAGAIIAYVTVAPPTLADGYEKDAEAEHTKVEEALIPVRDTFNVEVFGTVPISRKLSARAYLRRYKKVAKADRRQLARAEKAVRKAKRALADVDEEAMTDAPSLPLLGGDLDEAEEIAGMEDDYLRKARAFVKDYEALVEYEQFIGGLYDRLNIADAEAELSVPSSPSSPGQLTRPLQGLIRTAATQLKRMQKRKPPARLKASHRNAIAEIKAGIADNRALVSAINNRDLNRVENITDRMDREAKADRRASRKELSKLVYSSRYTRQIDDLEKRENRISKAFEEL